MKEWFTTEQLDENTYAISEYGHWEQAHSYLLMGSKLALLIDTGLGIGNIKKEVNKLTDLPVKVVTTHAHWDHIGGHAYFDDIAVHKADAVWLKDGLPIPKSVIIYNIISKPFKIPKPKEFQIENYEIYTGNPNSLLEDGDSIDLGNRSVTVIHTPGHSPGHICLWEKDRGYLFTGDLIYKGTLYAFYPSTNPLQFKQSVDKISNLDFVRRILPGHNEINIKPELIQKVKDGFEMLDQQGVLKQGSGIIRFEEFSIQL
ncbi:MBL fold metallo-hydrolase [Anaerocolumna sp. MB42-C2]|uniref:MBL fold metallo-hydrolase n=1 Tax=Anaerocolumna sp. MB42-C2 TaxID=3070997 RepID=UPI0027E211FA|nr:MBL fold metallo-hydrolase [Anaerocolumna sp. MB42-C2]WMJ86269.1 MBL fold metallo-hydrolase [Anaerocolumna sp. MB42-C2]